MRNFVFALLAIFAVGVFTTPAEARFFGRRANVNVNVNRNGRNVQKVVVRDNVRVEKVVVRDNHAHFQNVVVEKVVVDNHGHAQRVRVVERVRVR